MGSRGILGGNARDLRVRAFCSDIPRSNHGIAILYPEKVLLLKKAMTMCPQHRLNDRLAFLLLLFPPDSSTLRHCLNLPM